MAFPATREHEDERGLFLVQDPLIRSKVLPLFSFDPRDPIQRPIGQGTAFRIDPWGTCATAFHVIEELLKVAGGKVLLRDDIRLAALELEGLGYGVVPLPQDCWRPFAGMFSVCGVESPPLSAPRVRNLTELAALSIQRSANAHGQTTFLPIDMRRWQPAVGERIMALGFADLDRDKEEEGDARAMSQYLYGSEASITEVRPADPASSRPWPIFRVEAYWPGGMSGGPVFNEAGHVVGMVSTGFNGASIGSAVSFAGWNMPERTFASLDPSNPGWIKCWAALDAKERVIKIAPASHLLDDLLSQGDATEVVAVTLDPNGEGFVRIKP